MKFEYNPRGVCSVHYVFDIEDDIIKDVQITGGCNGNLKGISRLITGMNINDVIEKLSGTTCGYKPTSCPDQIARALKQYSMHKQTGI
ncbi:MAG: TIGR03905 family TSCPD domain-containing protein [Erysipelotrichaceae bacterium]|nr:TIGR03905 family TSCPD domain-containing protein [Erysipelotrichaceae bacterium]